MPESLLLLPVAELLDRGLCTAACLCGREGRRGRRQRRGCRCVCRGRYHGVLTKIRVPGSEQEPRQGDLTDLLVTGEK